MSSFTTKLLNGFAWRLCMYVSSFVLNIFIANKLGAEQSGIFYLLLNNIGFVVLAMSLGLDSAIAYFGSRKEISSRSLLLLSIAWSFIATISVTIIYFAAEHAGLINAHPLTPFILLNAGSSILANCAASVLFANNDNKTPNIIFSIVNIVLVLLLPGILVNDDPANTAYTKIYLAISALPALLFVTAILFKKNGGSFNLPKRSTFKNIARFSIMSFAYTLMYTLLLRCDYWLVNYFCADADLGNYLQATKIAQIILLVPALASFSLFPLVVNHIHEERQISAKLVKLITIYFYVGLTLCIGVVATGYWIFPLLYGPSFSKMYMSFLLLSPGILLLAAAYPLATYFSGQNMIRIKIIALLLSLCILLITDLLLIPSLDIYGAAIGSTIAYCFYFGCLLAKFRKNHTFKIADLLKIRPVIRDIIPAILKTESHEKN